MSGAYDTNYPGYERNRLISNDKEEYITETMQEFLEFVEECDPNLLPKIKIMVGDFLSDQNIPTKELVNEDELEMLDKWIKSVKGE